MESKTFKFKCLGLALGILFFITGAWGTNLEVHIIDVGQGDCTLIVSPTGRTVLVDTGTSTNTTEQVVPYLSNHGITDLDYIVTSHYDRDHYAGVDDLIEALGGISHILYTVYDRGGAKEGDGPMFETYYDAVKQKRTTIEPEDVIDLGGGATLTCIGAGGKTKNGTVYSGDDENRLSVVLVLSYCDFQMFLGGDVEGSMETATGSLAGDMDVYKVSHHGSKYSSKQSFLEAITPEVSTISVGDGNTYDHPTLEVLDRLVSVGSYIYQTETGNRAPSAANGEVANGSFTIETDGSAYTVSGSDISTAAYNTDGSDWCPVTFSEVLYDSEVFGDTDGEWIELYNSGAAAVNIGGWTIEDNHQTYTIPSGTVIGPNCTLVFAHDRSDFYQQHGCYPHISGLSLELNNTGDYLILKNMSGNEIDQVAWESGGTSISGWGSSSKPYADEGRSIVRSDLNQDTDTYADWLNNRAPDPDCEGTPGIRLNRTQLDFEVSKGGTASQVLSVTNSGCGKLNWTVNDNVNWLTCSPTSGTYSGEIIASVDSSGLEAGTYTGTITISDVNASNLQQTVSVTLTVSCEPEISLGVNQLNFNISCLVGTGSQTFSISNSGCGTLNWSVTDDADWLTCTPTSGTDSGVVTAFVNTNGLAAGTYPGTITVSDVNASNSPQTISVALTVYGEPEIALSRTQLSFGAANGTVTCVPQTFLIENTGCGTLNWAVTDNATWLSSSPTSGTGSGVVTVSVSDPGLAVGTYTGTIAVSDPDASNSPQTISVTLMVYSSDAPPFGEFATPTDGSTVRSSVPVTGWVLDDVGVESVKIYRQEGNEPVYIGDAQMVEGARPDIEQAYPQYPLSYKAGWGYMLLSNFLPNGGNGTFVLVAKARDCGGNEVTLGTKTITCDNASAVKPFGAIDTPAQGGIASGSSYRNNGWVLTPMPNSIPTDGSTINVYIDGVNKGNVVYNIYRADIASLFPGYANSNGAGAYFDLDTTAYANGVHTIYWIAMDNAGNSDGIGSRYFNVRNLGGARAQRAWSRGAWSVEQGAGSREAWGMEQGAWRGANEPVQIKKGYNQYAGVKTVYPDDNGMITIEIKELERLEIHLDDLNLSSFITHHSSFYSGHSLVGDQLKPLPMGSTLDIKRGVFCWLPVPGFIGEYEFTFIGNRSNQWIKRNIRVRIVPKF